MPYAGPYRPYNAIDVISRAEPSDGIGLGGRVVKERPKKAPDGRLSATSEFQHVAHVVTEMHERRNPALTAFIAARGLGMSPQELEAIELPPCPDL